MARGVAALEDSVGNGHAGVLYPVAHLGAAVMLGVVEHWRDEVREQALTSLLELLDVEVLTGYETYVTRGVRVDVEEAIHRQVPEAVPLLKSVIDG